MNNFSINKYLFLIFAFGLNLVFSGCKNDKAAAPEEPAAVVAENNVKLNAAQIQSAGVVSGMLEQKEITSNIRVNGKITVPPGGTASVSAPLGGYVRSLSHVTGNYVKKGQSLATIEDPQIVELQQDYLLARSNQEYSSKDYERQKELNQSKASSDKVTEKSKTESTNHQIMVRSLAQKLRALGINPDRLTSSNIVRRISVPSPISGYITEVNASLGQYVSPSDNMFVIMNTASTFLELKVFEKDLGKVSAGQTVTAYTNQDPGRKYNAKVKLITKDFDTDRSVMVHASILNPDQKLIPGTFMTGEIRTKSHQALVAPEDAIVTWEDQQYIFEEKTPGEFEMVPVSIGTTEAGLVELTNAQQIDTTKKYVVKGAYSLLMALKNVEE